MAKFKMSELKGVIPAIFTCFDENENVDVARIEKFTNYLIAKGAGGFYLTGSTGEGFVMTTEERKLVVETICKVVDGRVPVVVHVGSIGAKVSKELAVHAEACGADAVSSVSPFYYKWSDDQIYGYYKEICDAISIPMMIYNVGIAGLMGPDLVKRIAGIKNVAGLKFTAKDHDILTMLKVELGEDFRIYSGCDEMAVSGMLSGSSGIIGTFYNTIPETYIKLLEAVEAGDYKKAMHIQTIATRFIHFVLQFEIYSVLKAILKEKCGMDVGIPRKPLSYPSEETMNKVYAFCDQLKAEYGTTYIDFIDNPIK